MENKSKNAIIALLGLVVLVLIGYICYDKIASAAKKDSENHNTEEIPQVQIPSITKEEVSKLIDQYYFEAASPSDNLFTVEMDDHVKKNITIKQSYKEIKTIDCTTVSGYVVSRNGICTKADDEYVYTRGDMIDYASLNNKYQYLFGKNNVLSKEDFKDFLGISTWEYIADKDFFLSTFVVGGAESGPFFTTYEVKNFSQLGDNLFVNVGYVYMRSKTTADHSTVFTTMIAGKEVSYLEDEIYKENFRAEFLDKYLDKLDTYRFTFKYEEDHYVLVGMKKM